MLSRYTTDLKITTTNRGVRYYETVLSTPIPIDTFQLVITAQDGDRLDSLASRYYQDTSKWWIIAKANGMVNGTMFIRGGTQLNIPSAGLL